MSRSDSRDSTKSTSSFTSAPMQTSYSTSPATFQSSSSAQTSSTRMQRDSFSSGWVPSPYRSCMMHSSSSSQGYESSSSSYISDDDLLALDSLPMPPVEHIPSPTSAPQQEQPKREMTTEEQIAMLREMQEREQAQLQQQRQRAQQQRAVRFATEHKKPRRPSNQRRITATRRT
ncbi:hypothetical protein PMZ80_001623 [Knufia obscura]|uniref:Uncharacterized protein n=2 Tax=Knufia TaxID=430999 RepID=A0AAN8I9C8_9EURO|nr:hypothetical protein PMZ80_001623 [Knufia obscura]KAK5955551.1 hypothetical protein OHC33_003192 [Knufia fluminis]